jgi:hypothetical protein
VYIYPPGVPTTLILLSLTLDSLFLDERSDYSLRFICDTPHYLPIGLIVLASLTTPSG